MMQQKDCRHGADCRKFGCKYAHPPQRVGDCRHGAKCHRAKCHFLHPKPASATPAVAAAAAGGSLALQVRGHGQTEVMQLEKISGGRPKAVFSCAVDTSGSMAGHRTDAALAGLKNIFDGAMQDTDKFALQTFSQEVRSLHRAMEKSKVSWQKDEEHIRANRGARTALYDAIAEGLDSLKDQLNFVRGQQQKREKRVVPVQLVITDGEDNCSRRGLADVKRLLDESGRKCKDFHFFLVAVGLSGSAMEEMKELCAEEHCTFLHAADAEGFRLHLRTVEERFRLKLSVCQEDGTRMKVQVEGTARGVAKQAQKISAASKILQSADVQLALSGAARSRAITGAPGARKP